jgi:NADH-quinone oxidoreductase subunit A
MLANSYNQWAALGIVFLIGLIFAGSNVLLSHLMGPARRGKVKDDVYESGVDPAGDTKKRFNVRFYLVAMIFLVFDVEVLFLVPWITIFAPSATLKLGVGVTALFLAMITFTVILLVSYAYAWGKGVFKWD